jgi:hypothetical protein
MPKILLFHYFGGGGGKFISNCLATSGYVAPPNFNISLLNDKETTIQCLLNTIPKKSNSRNWLNLEMGCWQLFGKGIVDISQKGTTEKTLNNINQLTYQWLPLMSHDMNEFNNYLYYFKNYAIFTVLVDATTDFIDFAIRLKWPEDHHCLDLEQYQKFTHDLEGVTFDFIFNDWDPRIQHNLSIINNLADKLQISYDENKAKEYIDKYIQFHS